MGIHCAPILEIAKTMPAKKFLICTQHLEGPLDVWYDCSQCEQGSKHESLPHLQWMTRREIQGWPEHTAEMLLAIKDYFARRRRRRTVRAGLGSGRDDRRPAGNMEPSLVAPRLADFSENF